MCALSHHAYHASKRSLLSAPQLLSLLAKPTELEKRLSDALKLLEEEGAEATDEEPLVAMRKRGASEIQSATSPGTPSESQVEDEVKAPALKKPATEAAHRVNQRQKQISFGKATAGYVNRTAHVATALRTSMLCGANYFRAVDLTIARCKRPPRDASDRRTA